MFTEASLSTTSRGGGGRGGGGRSTVTGVVWRVVAKSERVGRKGGRERE